MLVKYFPTELRTQPSTKNLIVSSFTIQMHLMTGTFGGRIVAVQSVLWLCVQAKSKSAVSSFTVGKHCEEAVRR